MSPRIGAVSYLNTKPLIHGFQDRFRSLFPSATLLLDLPSRLADLLTDNQLDVALIPSVEFLRASSQRNPLTIVSSACIGCRGPVRSVQLLFRRAPQDVRTLSLDEGSRTSAALAQVLLAREYNVRPELRSLSIHDDFRSDQADAAVVIGDRAMQIDTRGYYAAWDLGQHWFETTGLPFVFAMWVQAHSESFSASDELSRSLEDCRDYGLQNLPAIVKAEAAKYNLAAADCYRYFTEQLHFFLGEEEFAGLELFRSYASELGLIPADHSPFKLQAI